jgi:CHAT domain-containing protein
LAFLLKKGVHSNALDEVLFSYAPNARSLRVARENAKRVNSCGVLVVDDPQPVSAPPLLYSGYEASAAIDGLPEHLYIRLRHDAATVEAVRTAIADYPILHFSCHGISELRDPLDSSLFLAKYKTLTLRDVLGYQFVGTRLAVLSACESAIPGIKLIDEVISLPIGFLEAGVAAVIGSLWAVNEPSTMELMVRFYELWRTGSTIAEALHKAQQEVRDTTVAQKRKYLGERLEDFIDPWNVLPDDTRVYSRPYYWSAFIHVGV